MPASSLTMIDEALSVSLNIRSVYIYVCIYYRDARLAGYQLHNTLIHTIVLRLIAGADAGLFQIWVDAKPREIKAR